MPVTIYINSLPHLDKITIVPGYVEREREREREIILVSAFVKAAFRKSLNVLEVTNILLDNLHIFSETSIQ